MLPQKLFSRPSIASFPEHPESLRLGTYLNFLRSSPDELPPPPPDEFPRRHSRGATPRSPLIRTLALLAAIALTTLFALPFVTHAASERSFVTRIGQQLPIPLEDGSTITLNTDSALTIRSDGEHLRANVLNGEVLFNMHSNPHRHLTVVAGNLQIDDIATIFAVRRLNAEDTRVTVEEGQVELTGRQLAGVRLTANHRATLDHHVTSRTLHVVGATPDVIQRELAWRDGHVAFFGEKLAEVASELNRYNITQIEIPDPTLSQLPMGGSFSPTDLGAFIRTISTMDPTILAEPSHRPDGTPTLILHHPPSAPHVSTHPHH